MTAEEERQRAVLFNDITRAPISTWLLLSDRMSLRDRIALTDHLWAQGWRREVRPEDVTE